MKTTFDIADEIIEKAYPDFANKGKGWWGENRIPNWGILRGAIAIALEKNAALPSAMHSDGEERCPTCRIDIKKYWEMYRTINSLTCRR